MILIHNSWGCKACFITNNVSLWLCPLWWDDNYSIWLQLLFPEVKRLHWSSFYKNNGERVVVLFSRGAANTHCRPHPSTPPVVSAAQLWSTEAKIRVHSALRASPGEIWCQPWNALGPLSNAAIWWSHKELRKSVIMGSGVCGLELLGHLLNLLQEALHKVHLYWIF